MKYIYAAISACVMSCIVHTMDTQKLAPVLVQASKSVVDHGGHAVCARVYLTRSHSERSGIKAKLVNANAKEDPVFCDIDLIAVDQSFAPEKSVKAKLGNSKLRISHSDDDGETALSPNSVETAVRIKKKIVSS